MTDDALDPVFRALADPTRRAILDALFERDGQSLSALEAGLPMSRFGVMKHLRVLEAANLVSARKSGREKLHFLNPVPIAAVHDRWVSRYARRWTGPLITLKRQLEAGMTDAIDHVYEIFIRTDAQTLWDALIDPKITEQYYFGSRFDGEAKPGAAYAMLGEGGEALLKGEVLEAEPPRRLVQTFIPLWTETPADTTRVIWEIDEVEPGLCKLSLTHEGLVAGAELTEGVKTGWARILSGLKTVLETGGPMKTAA